jgi:nucleotide-binding universal stress UspA family protein
MKRLPCIVCGFDFSPSAGEAATVAAKLAQRNRERLQLVHASLATAETRVLIKAQLEAEAQRLRQIADAVEPILLEDANPVAALLSLIRAESPTLVVVGWSSKGPLDRWVVGSFSERIAESSSAPTLVVRNPAVFTEWDWTKNRLKVLLALDLYSSSNVVLRWAQDFRAAGPCDLVACYVNRQVPTFEEQSGQPCLPPNPPALQRRLEEELQKKVRDQIGDDVGAVVVKPSLGDPSAHIVAIAAETNAHLIAVGTHQRHGLSRLTHMSVSRGLLRAAATNVVCIPVTAEFNPHAAHIPDFRRVLVATDFSPLGNAAVPFACAVCCAGGVVKTVHVAAPRTHHLRQAGRGWPTDLNEKLQAVFPHEMAFRCQSAEVEVLEDGDVARAICAEAERFGADLVCLASHGQGASPAVRGSIATAVMKKIRRPLLIVRQPEE